MISLTYRSLGSLAALAVLTATAAAQTFSPAAPQNVCIRLESQLATLDRGAADPARQEQIRRYEDAAGKQQAELDRIVVQSRRTGCEGSGFFVFGGQPAQCGPLNQQIQQMRSNLDRIYSDLQRIQSPTGGDQNNQRRVILAALAQNDCGPQYRVAAPAQPRGFFDTLFGGSGPAVNSGIPAENLPPAGTFRTVCVRTCDGFYWPISYATVPGKFSDDERTCQRMCPAAEVQLFSHRNPGEDVAQAVSTGGRQYSQLPTAFRYRQAFDSACSCRKPGETWADALKQIGDTVERGDIVVTEERAKQLSQPRNAQGQPVRQPTGAQPAAPGAQPAVRGAQQPPNAPEPAKTAEPAPPARPQGPVRTVGPQFLPVR